MNHIHFARAYLREARLRLDTAKSALLKKAYAYCVRQSQEAGELALKAALRLIGIDYPKWHDVSGVLQQEAPRFPSWFQAIIPALATASKLLGSERELAMYGDEVQDASPGDLFTVQDAVAALRDARHVFFQVQKLVREIKASSTP